MAKEQQKGWAAVGKATKALSQQDQTVRAEADRDREQTQRGVVALADVKSRPHGDTRQVDAYHVLELAESVAALGLLEPLVVDRKLQLLAGAHRWEAMRLLAIRSPDERATGWGVLAGIADLKDLRDAELTHILARIRALAPLPEPAHVPVRIVEFDATAEEERALSIEIAENEKRRDYTRPEVEALMERLKKAGYRFSRGKPKTGEQALGPALALIIGKSERTVRRILGVANPGAEQPAAPADGSEVARKRIKRLRQAIQEFRKATKGPAGRRFAAIAKAAAALELAIDEADVS